jgi:hypothetical protein
LANKEELENPQSPPIIRSMAPDPRAPNNPCKEIPGISDAQLFENCCAVMNTGKIPLDPESREKLGETLGSNPPKAVLHQVMGYAASMPDLELMEWLVARGADPTDPENIALGWACAKGKKTAVVWLLEKGACPNDNGMINASNHGHTEIVDLLLKRGVKPCSEALQMAISGNHLETLSLLLENGAEVESPWCVESCLLFGRPQVLEVLIKQDLEGGAPNQGNIRALCGDTTASALYSTYMDSRSSEGPAHNGPRSQCFYMALRWVPIPILRLAKEKADHREFADLIAKEIAKRLQKELGGKKPSTGPNLEL